MSQIQILFLAPASKGCQAAPPHPPSSGHSAWKPFKPSSSTFLCFPAVAFEGQALSASGLCYWGFPPLAFHPPIHPSPLATCISQSSHLFFPKLTNLPPSNGIPRAWGVGPSTNANQLPPAPTSALHAGCPAPHCLCSFLALMLGNHSGMPVPFRPI